MGNMMDIKTEDGNKETIKEVVTELQKQMNAVDHSMTGLAKSIDSMQAACKLLSLHKEKKPENKDHDPCLVTGDDERTISSSEQALDLLRCIEESVTDHKFIAMEGISKLLHFIARTLQRYRVSTSENDAELSLDTYLSAKNPFDSKCTYYDEKVKSLCSEVGMLKDIKRSLHSRIELQNKKELSLINEKENLCKQLSQLEKKFNSISKENQTELANRGHRKDETSTDMNKTHLEDDSKNETKQVDVTPEEYSKSAVRKQTDTKTQSESEKSTLKEDIKRPNEEKKTRQEENPSGSVSNKQERMGTIVQVQIYRSSPDSNIDTKFFDMLKSKAQKKALNLNTMRRATQQAIKPDKPVLVLCVSNSGTPHSKMVEDAIKGIVASLKVGVVIFHMGNVKSVKQKSSLSLKRYPPYSLLGGIFDITCGFYGGSILPSDDNDNSIDGIINFISKRG